VAVTGDESPGTSRSGKGWLLGLAGLTVPLLVMIVATALRPITTFHLGRTVIMFRSGSDAPAANLPQGYSSESGRWPGTTFDGDVHAYVTSGTLTYHRLRIGDWFYTITCFKGRRWNPPG
jgi:hypothetical protein